jgi:A/G-specific adenine glycosylase
MKSGDNEFLKDLSAYYTSEGRHSLLWRKKITPYRILVSEVMLQQTQVSRVLPKFKEWMIQFPTLSSLKQASLKDILVLWQGLGYQRRAKALLTIAKEVKVLPITFEALLALPGIGPYTASAICAFAHNTFTHPVLETNIRTVLIEYFHQGENEIHDSRLYDDLNRLVTNKKVKSMGARHFYYALMDFGAHLKSKKISHNKKSIHHITQTAYKGSSRELRAKVLFAITKNLPLPNDERLELVLMSLTKEKFIVKNATSYSLAD